MPHFLKLICYTVCVIIFGCFTVVAQNEQIDEEEVSNQKRFIEASKQKLLGKLEDAKKIYLEIYRSNRQNHASAYEIARISEALEDNEDTEKYIKHAINADPANQWYRRYFARFLEENKRLEESMEQYEKLISSFPEEQSFYEKLGAMYESQGRWDDALRVYTGLENEKGLQENIVRKMVICFDELGKEKEAIAALKNLVDAYPGNTRYLNFLAFYYEQANNKKEALGIYKQVISIEPDNDFANIAVTKLNSSDKPKYSILNSFKSLIENPQIDIDSKIPELIPIVSEMDMDSNSHAGVLDLLQRLTEVHPNEAKSFAIYADALIKAGKIKSAIDNYQRTIQLNHTIYAVWEQLMYSQASIGDFEGLGETAEQSLDYYPNQALGYYFFGLALFNQENYTEAADILMEARLIATSDPVLLYKVQYLSAQNTLATGNSNKALSLAEDAQKLVKNKDPFLYELLGDIYAHMAINNPEELFMRGLKSEDAVRNAKNYYQKAIDAGGNGQRLSQKMKSPTLLDK